MTLVVVGLTVVAHSGRHYRRRTHECDDRAAFDIIENMGSTMMLQERSTARNDNRIQTPMATVSKDKNVKTVIVTTMFGVAHLCRFFCHVFLAREGPQEPASGGEGESERWRWHAVNLACHEWIVAWTVAWICCMKHGVEHGVNSGLKTLVNFGVQTWVKMWAQTWVKTGVTLGVLFFACVFDVVVVLLSSPHQRPRQDDGTHRVTVTITKTRRPRGTRAIYHTEPPLSSYP